jgi:C4-dicarboxylate-specific signal transduction histidine kinase
MAKARLNDLAHAARLITAGELAAGLAHELNQPLAAISAYADGAARRLAAEDGSPDTMQLLGKISDQARRAGQIIHRLKDLVRKQTPHRAACRLDVLLHETLELVEPTAESRAVAIVVATPPDLPRVEADWVQLQQVFLNLLTNALDAMGDSPSDERRIRIEAAPESDTDAVRVVIEDSGPGLRGVDPEQLFESFYSTKAKGMGLGLPISRSIIEAHNGRLWCEAREGHGARFVLIMPCVRGEVAANG